MYKLLVSFRYLYRKRLNVLAIVGVAIGVMALLVVLSVMTGFDKEMRQRIRGTLSDLIVESLTAEEFENYDELITKIEAIEHVKACSPHLDGLALVKLEDRYRWAEYRGIELDRECRVSELPEYWRSARGNAKLQECRRALSLLENPGEISDAPGWEETQRDEAVSLARTMREKDFAKLTKKQRKQILGWATAQGGDLKKEWAEIEQEMPTWGPPLESNKVPVIAGEELLVLGLSSDGTPVGLGEGEEFVAVTIIDVLDRGIKTCVVGGTFKSGMYEYDLRNFYMPLESAQKISKRRNKATSINVRLDDYANVNAVRATIMGIPTLVELEKMASLMRPLWEELGGKEAAARIARDMDELRVNYSDWLATINPKLVWSSLQLRGWFFEAMQLLDKKPLPKHRKRLEKLRQLRTVLEEREKKSLGSTFWASTWESKRRNILRAVAVERKVMAVILFFFFVIAGFLILALLHTTVVEKTKDIGILKSLGGTVGGIMSIFLLNGFLIGLFGSALGTLGGIMLCRHLNDLEDLIYSLTRWRVFPREIYAFDKIPVDQSPGVSILIIAGSALVMSFLASLYPARKAAKLNPVEALRYE